MSRLLAHYPAANPDPQTRKVNSRLFEIARVLVRFTHVASFIATR
jgi:hypothetical protein